MPLFLSILKGHDFTSKLFGFTSIKYYFCPKTLNKRKPTLIVKKSSYYYYYYYYY